MTFKDNHPNKSSELRQRATGALHKLTLEPTELRKENISDLIHELQVYQIEIELQNEDLRTSQMELEKSRDAYITLYNSAPVGYFSLDHKNTIVNANVTGADMLGEVSDTLVGKPFTNWISRESQDIFYLHRQSLFEAPHVAPCELQLTRQNGSRFDAQLESVAIDQNDDNPFRIHLTLTNITQRKKAERAAVEREAQLHSTIANLPYGIVVIDHNRRILLSNPTAQRYLTDLAEVLPGNHLYKLGSEPVESILAYYAESTLTKLQPDTSIPAKSDSLEITLATSPPQLFEVLAQPVVRANDQWILVLRDITAIREAEQYAHRQERLAAVGQLATGIAHDINNILHIMMSYAELTKEQPRTSSLIQSSLTEIIQQGDRAAGLIHQILDFSHASISAKQTIDMLPLLEETVGILERTLNDNIIVSLSIDSKYDTFPTNADATQLQQVLLNLALNAQSAMPDGGELQFNISKMAFQSPDHLPAPEMALGGWSVLSVVDSGTGIAPEHRPHIFEPFFTTKEVGQGSGLGLAQVHGIVTQHEGVILVDAPPDGGTRFAIYFPEAILEPSEPMLADSSAVPRGDGQTILLVDDDQVIIDVTKKSLEHLGYTVITAINGQEALALFAQHQTTIGLVLTDITMPVMDGITMAEVIYKQAPMLKVIGFTGYPLRNNPKALKSEAIVELLEKPVRFKNLARAINQHVKSPFE